MAKILFIMLFLICIAPEMQGSDTTRLRSVKDKYFFYTGFRFHYGYIITHTREIADITKSNPLGLQLDMGWHLNTRNAYNFCNCYPRIGLSLSYWDFKNPNILGKGGFAIFFLEPFLASSKWVSFSIRPGVGLAYLNNPYDSVSNPLNLSYSTHIAWALYLNASVYLNVNPRLSINASLNMNHISNGGVKLPNKGLNYPSLSFGADYSIRPRDFNRFNNIRPEEVERKRWFFMYVFFGFKSVALDNNTYYVYGTQVKHTWQLGLHSAVSGGVELIYDAARQHLVESYRSMHKNSPYIGSVNGGYEHLLGRFRFTFDLGMYFFHKDRGDLLYQRYGAKYRIWKSMFAGVNLKAHRHHAEFFDIRLGFQL